MKLILSILLLCFLNLPAMAAEKFLDIQEVTSESGLTGWLVEDNSLPVIALQFTFMEAGAARDGADKQGLVRLLSNTMDEGAGDLTSQQFQKALADHSISLHFSASRDQFGGSLKTLTRNKELAFDLLAKALKEPRFDEEAVSRMRQGNLARIRSSLSDPDWLAARLMNERAYEGHPYALNSGGTLSTLTKITPEDLRTYQQSALSKDRLLVAAAGDITPEEFKTLLDQLFVDLPNTAPQSEALSDVSIQNQNSVALYQAPIPQTVVEIMLPAFGREDEDYYALQVMNYLFGGAGFGSRLMEEIREKRGLTYGIYSSLVDQEHNQAMSISTSTKNDSVKEMLDVIAAEMTALATNPVSDDELANAKSYLIGSMPLALSSTDNIAGIALSLQTDDLPIDYLDHYAEHINSVTAADIQRVAQRVLKPEAMTVSLVGTPTDIEPTITIEKLPNVE